MCRFVIVHLFLALLHQTVVAQLLDKLCKYFSHMGFKMKSSLTKTQLYVCYVLIRIPQLGRTWLYVGLVAFFFLFLS